MLKNKLPLLYQRYAFHTGKSLGGQEGRAFNKLMGNKKKKYYVPVNFPILPSIASPFGKTSFETKITGHPKRANRLNKLFMRHVTDLMATGEYSKEIAGLGIEVNKVNITGDYKCLRVYYMAPESGSSEEIEKVLMKNAGFLRHELSNLQLMGNVPRIIFIKDKNYCKVSEVQARLQKADFGDDYESVDYAEHFKTEFELLTSLDPATKEKLASAAQDEVHNNVHNDLDDIPPMPHNVLGLDHSEILKRVKSRLSLSKASHRSRDSGEWVQWSQFKSTQPTNQDPVAYATYHEQKMAFKEFLHQRQILKNKQNRLEKNFAAEREYLEEEFKERQFRLTEEITDENFEEDDYIIDDVEENKLTDK